MRKPSEKIAKVTSRNDNMTIGLSTILPDGVVYRTAFVGLVRLCTPGFPVRLHGDQPKCVGHAHPC
jgi:hypothetical protein